MKRRDGEIDFCECSNVSARFADIGALRIE